MTPSLHSRPSRWLLPLCLILTGLCGYLSAETTCHDANFVPDAVLRVTQRTYTSSCIVKPDVVLVNGSSPGPELRLVEGKTYWIRVYNDMMDQNLTMVGDESLWLLDYLLTRQALAWSQHGRIPFFRWHPTC